MANEIKTWLYDIQDAIREIESFMPRKKDFTNFQNDLKTKRAVERDIEIIGEAVNRILQHSPKVSISNARKIVDTRNRIIHGYDSVSEEILWSIVLRDLPVLKEEVDSLLKTI